MNFLLRLSDMDVNNASTGTVEAFTPDQGFEGLLYQYASSNLTYGSTSASLRIPGSVRICSRINQNCSGDNAYLKAGLIAPTAGGEFSFVMSSGAAGSSLIVSAPISDVSAPVKDHAVLSETGETKEKIDTVGDRLHYTVSYKFGTFFKDTWVSFEALTLTDTVPEGLEIIAGSGKVSLGSTDVTADTSIGTLSLSAAKMDYVLSPAWLSDTANYDGCTFTVEFDCRAAEGREVYSNTAKATIGNDEVPSNTVEDAPQCLAPSYIYVSGTEGFALPAAISTQTGDCAITDTRLFLKGETVLRDDSRAVGTAYPEYLDGKLIAVWTLQSWDKDSAVIHDADLLFTGTWTRELPPPETGDPFSFGLYIGMMLLCFPAAVLLRKRRCL